MTQLRDYTTPILLCFAGVLSSLLHTSYGYNYGSGYYYPYYSYYNYYNNPYRNNYNSYGIYDSFSCRRYPHVLQYCGNNYYSGYNPGYNSGYYNNYYSSYNRGYYNNNYGGYGSYYGYPYGSSSYGAFPIASWNRGVNPYTGTVSGYGNVGVGNNLGALFLSCSNCGRNG